MVCCSSVLSDSISCQKSSDKNFGEALFSSLLLSLSCILCLIFTILSSVLSGSLIYEKLGERAFGWPGKMAAFGSIIMQNIGGRPPVYIWI